MTDVNHENERATGAGAIRALRAPEEIASDVTGIAAKLRGLAAGRVPVFVGILKGSFVFMSDLVRAYGEPLEMDFLTVKRFDPAMKDPSAVKVLSDLSANVNGRLVIVVEGIRTHGTKIEYVDRFLRLHNPQEILYCALVRQGGAEGGRIPLHAYGFDIGGAYVVGYGLDVEERYRNRPGIGMIEAGATAGGS